MNRFEHHHRDSISFSYSCFDRLIFNGYIPSFQHTACGGTIYWFLRSHRQAPLLNRAYFGSISRDYHEFVQEHATTKGVDIVVPEKDIRREELVEPYFQQLGNREGLAVILKAREPERIAWYFANTSRIEVVRRYVDLYYFYLNDPHCGRMFLRICPYFPFNISVWMNGHNWLACQLQKEGIAFEKRDNLFVACSNPQRLQALSDAFAPADVIQPVESWLTPLLPFFTATERAQGFRHQLYMSQMEYCHNMLFHKKAAADRLFERLMDANRGIGHPDKLAILFGRPKFKPDTRAARTTLKETEMRMPVLSTLYKSTGTKQYVREGTGMRVESSSHQLTDLSIKKNINNLDKVRDVMDTSNQRYLNVQQDILESYVDRGQMEDLGKPTVSAKGRRVPGMHVDDPRLLAVLQAILIFAYVVAKGCFRTRDLLVDVQKALGDPDYTMNQLRYDLSKLRGKGLVVRLPQTQKYQFSPEGYRIGVFYLKLHQKLYAPITSAICAPVREDNEVLTSRQTKLDRLYGAVDKALQNLTNHLGMAV
jgi:hypothetical protein